MSIVHHFEVILLMIAACVGLTFVARRLRLPEAAALIVGGLVLAVVPGVPDFNLDPDLVLVLFLPPLLLLSAYLTDWRALKADLRIILQLAVGAVVFTTLAVGWVTHLVLPGLPWAACFALGAIVSPPDAVAAKAVLQGLPLPARVVTLLEGESLLNDATGLVLYRLTVVATLTGAFSSVGAVGSFAVLVIGGVMVGLASGFLASTIIAKLRDGELGVTASFLAAWGSYIVGDQLDVSGVLATVACGIVMGWRQHSLIDARHRQQARSVWRVVSFVLESLIFIFIGLSLRGVLRHLRHSPYSPEHLVLPVGCIVLAVILARFVWIVLTTYGVRWALPALRRFDPYPPFRVPLVMSWTGMRGVVSLAAALALPDQFPGRDILLLATFAVILVTVLIQGTTLAPLVRWLRFDRHPPADKKSLGEHAARQRIIAAQIAAVEAVSLGQDGTHAHPRMIEQYRFRLEAVTRAVNAGGALDGVRSDHFDAVLVAVTAGRAELLRLHQRGEIDIEVLRALETELDADEVRARHLGGQR